ncbi:response regulator [Singulisphaera rosea]
MHQQAGDRVLIVEDDDTTRRALQRLFASWGWGVSTATTVAGALEALDPPPDMIILDLWLPDGDGVSVLRHVRKTGMRTFVAITSGALDPDCVARVLPLKPDLLMPKPLDLARLLTACSSLAFAPYQPQ